MLGIPAAAAVASTKYRERTSYRGLQIVLSETDARL